MRGMEVGGPDAIQTDEEDLDQLDDAGHDRCMWGGRVGGELKWAGPLKVSL